jgi:hypothetical protein
VNTYHVVKRDLLVPAQLYQLAASLPLTAYVRNPLHFRSHVSDVKSATLIPFIWRQLLLAFESKSKLSELHKNSLAHNALPNPSQLFHKRVTSNDLYNPPKSKGWLWLNAIFRDIKTPNPICKNSGDSAVQGAHMLISPFSVYQQIVGDGL